LVKNINSYIFLIFLIIIFKFFRIFENLFVYYWIVFEFWKKKRRPVPPFPTQSFPPLDPTYPADPSDPTDLEQITAKPLKINSFRQNPTTRTNLSHPDPIRSMFNTLVKRREEIYIYNCYFLFTFIFYSLSL
jgi:hypothetical protein